MKYLLLSTIYFVSTQVIGQNPKFPYPNHTQYLGAHIKPSYSQIKLDDDLSSFYLDWKKAYLKNDCGDGKEYYVFSENGAKNVSEAQGYGMMIVAFMAGFDENAKEYFDGLFKFYKSHPSNINSYLMDWQQKTCSDPSSSDDDSATDGDVDIAFALLLAHEQWGSNGQINYLQEALNVINAIMKDDINQSTWTVKLGDWSNSNLSKFYYATRTSDFIIGHFRAFGCYTMEENWKKIIDNCYELVRIMQDSFSPNTGLMPDFIVDLNTDPKPAGSSFLESEFDGDYYYNACRNPWRLGTDYLISGDERAKLALEKVNTWLSKSSNEAVEKISNGYKLDGQPINNWNDATYVGPFAVGLMANSKYQSWLNRLYDNLITKNGINNGGYYSHTIKLLSLFSLSGNYWVPNCEPLNINKTEEDQFNILGLPIYVA